MHGVATRQDKRLGYAAREQSSRVTLCVACSGARPFRLFVFPRPRKHRTFRSCRGPVFRSWPGQRDRARNPFAARAACAVCRRRTGRKRCRVAGPVPQSARRTRRHRRHVHSRIGRGDRALFRPRHDQRRRSSRMCGGGRACFRRHSLFSLARGCGRDGAGACRRGHRKPRNRAYSTRTFACAKSLCDERNGVVDDGFAEGSHACRSHLRRSAHRHRHRAACQCRARSRCADPGRGSRAQPRHRCRQRAPPRGVRRGAGDGCGHRCCGCGEFRRPRGAASAAPVLRL